jgi:hypothetical protein
VSKLIKLRMTGTLLMHIDAITKLGQLLTANILRNAAAVQVNANAHVFTLQEMIQIDVLLSTLPVHFNTCVQSLWQKLNLVNTITAYDLRYKDDAANQRGGGGAREAEALAVDDLSVPLNITVGTGAGRPAKVMTGTDSRTGEKVNLLCTHCQGVTCSQS